MPADTAPMLDARLTVSFGNQEILRDIHLRISRGGCTGLVGQSGSGKSTLSLALLGLLGSHAQVHGSILLDGRELLGQTEREWREVRGRRIALVLQSASSALNPALRIESHLKEAWRAHSTQPWRAARPAAIKLFRSFDLPCTEDFLHRFPSQVSVGQAQRILISMALLHRPALLIADEVTSAVDLLTQREVLSSLRRANTDWGTAVLHITHDLLSVPELCRDIVVLEKGLVVESGPCLQVLSEPVHPYTRRLIEALPAIHRRPAPLHQQPAGAAVRS